MIRYLGITLEKLLILDPLKGAKVLGGETGLSQRVTKVNVMEVPDIIEWVSEGELLITTAYSIKDNISILYELIPRLKSRGVVGLGIKVGRYIQELPENIIKLSDELSFPIIEMPLNVSHTDVISAILTEVINDHMNMLIKMEDFNREVMRIMIKGGGLNEIARKLYDNIGNALAIYENLNDSYELICDDALDRKIIDKIIVNHVSLKHIKNAATTEVIYETFQDTIGERIFERVTIPIIIEKIEYGCILIWLDKKALTPLDNMLIESYVHIIALEFVKKLALNNLESNYKLDFFDDILSDNESRQSRALEKAKTFNFHKELKTTVIIILLKELYGLNSLTHKKASFAKEWFGYLILILNRLSKSQNERIVFVEKSDRILILYGSEPVKDPKLIKKEVLSFCEKIQTEMLKKYEVNQLIFGIGRCYDGLGQLSKSHGQAKLIVENLSKTNSSSIIHYDNLGLYRILSYDGLQNELAEFCSETIKPLVEFDKANDAELVKTLKCYFQYNGNMKKMSEKMFMHYNTIIYRIQKIKDITGLDIENSDTRLNLEIALKIMDLNNV